MIGPHDAGGGVGPAASDGVGETVGGDAETRGAAAVRRGPGVVRIDEPDSRRDVPTRVPDGEAPGARCPHCERPFRTERLRDLHVGEVHAELSSEAEREAHEEADEAELDELFFYHIKVVVLIGLLFSAFVLGYTVVLSGGA